MIQTNDKAVNQIMHEAETTRQNARYRIPAKIEIDGKKYKVLDWSLSGCAIEDLPEELCQEKKCKQVKLIFTFDDFTTMIDNIDVDFICKERGDNEEKMVGGRFHNLNPSQIAILNQIITAYLNDDILTQEDIIHAVSRQITYPKKVKKGLEKKKADKLLILIYTTVALLIAFLLFVAYQRLFVVQTVNGYVDVNLTTVRSPYPSYIHFTQPIKKSDKVDINDTLAVAYFIGGGVQPIHSAIKGTIYNVSVKNNQFRNTAEPILTVLPTDAQAYIVTHIEHKYFKKIHIGNVAKVRFANGKTLTAKITKIMPAEAIDLEHTKVLANIYNQARDYDVVILKPSEALDPSFLNTSVFVTIDTLFQ